jgi:predicted secreted protein
MAAERAFGATLTKLMSGSEVADTVIANLTSISRIGLESEEIDVTDFDSQDDFREFIAGIKDAGEFAIAGWIKSSSNVEALLALANSRSVESWEVEMVRGDLWEFDGFVKMFEEGELTVDGVRNFSGTIRISGAPTFTAADAS